MERAEIKAIGDYLKDLEEGLYEWDYRGMTALYRLPELYRIIKLLMDETFKAKDKQLKVLLARKLAEHYCQLKSSDGGVVVLCFTGSSTIDRLRANHIEIRHFLMNPSSFLGKKRGF